MAALNFARVAGRKMPLVNSEYNAYKDLPVQFRMTLNGPSLQVGELNPKCSHAAIMLCCLSARALELPS